MDPMSAIAIAGIVVQFVDFGAKLVKEASALYEDGESSIRKKAAANTGDLQDFIARFDDSLNEEAQEKELSEDEKALQTLCHNCRDLAQSLSAKLGTLNVKESHRVWKSLGTALSNVWSKKEIQKMEEDLGKYRQAIDTRMISLTRSAVTAMASQQSTKFNAMDLETKQIISGLTELRKSMENDSRVQRVALAHLLSRQEVVVQVNAETRTTINVHSTGGWDPACERSISQACDAARINEKRLRQAVSSAILDSLCFPMIAQRFDDVTEAHHDTFQWIFQRSDETAGEKLWDNFAEWLETGDGLYWINGKAGSGKSTLLKLVSRHAATIERLSAWKGDFELFTASFFFWSSGTMLQRSQEGMLRSLLHDILLKIPQLIPIVFPTHWASVYLQKLELPDSRPNCFWGLPSLMIAFETLLEQTIVPMRLCLFVDGLDEYSGLGSQIAQLFQAAAKAPQVKVCVSSRPHLIFKESFEAQPQLRLEDLTKGDIEKYVLDMLENNEMMQRRICREHDQMKELADEIVKSASGVFLWVKLIVMDLLRGLENHDQISLLQKRLRLLPTDLEELYEHMVFKVDKIYRVEASRSYQIMAATTEQEDDWSPALPLTIFNLFLAEQEDDLVFDAEPGFLSKDAITNGICDTDLRLRIQCGGLLETQFGKTSLKEIQPDMPVSYIHRTVRDYLDSTGIRHILSDRTGGLSAGSFNPNIALMKAYLLHLKTITPDPMNRHAAMVLMHAIITHARRAEWDLCEPNTELVDVFLQSSKTWLSKAGGQEEALELLGADKATFAVKTGLCNYLQTQLSNGLVKVDRLMLNRAVCPPSRQHLLLHKEIVNLLLEAGADPNERPTILSEHREDNQSPWQNAITYLATEFQSVPKKHSKSLLMRWQGVIKMLLQSGAKANTLCAGPVEITRDEKTGARIVNETTVTPLETVQRLYENHTRELGGLVKLLESKGAMKEPEDDQLDRKPKSHLLQSGRNDGGAVVDVGGVVGALPLLAPAEDLTEKVASERSAADKAIADKAAAEKTAIRNSASEKTAVERTAAAKAAAERAAAQNVAVNKPAVGNWKEPSKPSIFRKGMWKFGSKK